jgi:hypothetical protein
MLFNKQLKNYVSEIDHFLNDFNAKHPELSVSQKAEVIKDQKIAQLRDKAESVLLKDPFDF